MEGEQPDYNLFQNATSEQQKIQLAKLKEKISNSVDYLCDAIAHYDSLQNGKDFVCEQAADWIISSAFNQLDSLKQLMPTIEQICNTQDTFTGASPGMGSLRASFAIQSLYEGNDGPIVNFINLEPTQFINFAKPFAMKFSNVNPLNLEQHMAAKARFRDNYGSAFLGKLLENIANKSVCEAIIYFCKWFPANWFMENREVINQLFQNPELMHFPCAIYAQVLTHGAEFMDFDILQEYVYIPIELTEENYSQMLGPYSELFASQARLYATAAISLLSNSQTESIETLFQMAQYFFDPDRFFLKPDVVSQEVTRVLTRISIVEPKMVTNICELIIQRVATHLNPAANQSAPIQMKTQAIGELQNLFCTLSNRHKQTVDEFINNAVQSDQSTILPIFCLLLPLSKNKNNDMLQYLFDNLMVQYVSEVPGEITNETFPPFYLACEFIFNTAEVAEEESLVKQSIGNAFQIMMIVYTNQEIQWQFPGDQKTKNLHKEEIGKLIIDYAIKGLTNPEVIDTNMIIELAKLSKTDIKISTSLLISLPLEVYAQVLSEIIQRAKFDENTNGDIPLENVFTWLANAARVDNLEISNLIYNFLFNTQKYATSIGKWIQAFKCISLKVVTANLNDLYQMAGTSTIAHAALFDLIRTAQKDSDTIRSREQENFQDQELYENAQKFANQNWLFQFVPYIKNWFMDYVRNSLHYPTSSVYFKEVVMVLINNGLEFFQETRNSIANESESAVDELAQFIHSSILAERIDCPEIYKPAINCMQTLWAGPKKQIDAIDPERAVFLCNGTFMYFYSNEFDPNLTAWKRVLEYSMSIQIGFAAGMYQNITNDQEMMKQHMNNGNMIVEMLTNYLKENFVPGAMGYIANRAEALVEVLHQRDIKAEYLNEIIQAAKPANKNAISTFKANITKNITPIIYQMRQMTFFDM